MSFVQEKSKNIIEFTDGAVIDIYYEGIHKEVEVDKTRYSCMDEVVRGERVEIHHRCLHSEEDFLGLGYGYWRKVHLVSTQKFDILIIFD